MRQLLEKEDKMGIAILTSQLISESSKPDYAKIRTMQAIRVLEPSIGRAETVDLIFKIVASFCSGLNVVRNMNEYQMIDTAIFLRDEAFDYKHLDCDYRLEDFAVMFTLAKRGKIGKIMDRIDCSVIAQILDEYHFIRKRERENFERKQIEPAKVQPENASYVPIEKVTHALNQLVEARKKFENQEVDVDAEIKRKQQIISNQRKQWENE